jgi:SagB-type dehydrogenase family enzyme
VSILVVNRDITYASEYHEKTKHSEISLMTQRHYLDFDNRPIPFKIYTTDFPFCPLPSDFPKPELDAISAVSTLNPGMPNNAKFNKVDNKELGSTPFKKVRDLGIRDLAEILFFSAGITRAKKYGTTTYYMRAASATGALYPIELYVVCPDLISELEAGVYHFSPADFSLVQIRKGDYRPHLAAATAGREQVLSSPINLVLTSFAWRNAWKYQGRSYRHWFWDAGVIVANLLATTVSMGLTTNLQMGFIDDVVNRLLGLDYNKEAAVIIANIGGQETSQADKRGEKVLELPDSISPKIRPLSESEIDFPEIWKLHDASKLFSPEEIMQWAHGKELAEQLSDKDSLPSAHLEVLNRRPLLFSQQKSPSANISRLAEVILKRGSTRRFAKASLPFRILSSILYSSTRGAPLDFLGKEIHSLIDVYLICNDVEDLAPGGYFFNQKFNTVDLLKMKVSREMSGYLCLGQSLFSQASAVLFLMTDLQKVLKALGNRGYGASQFEAGIIAGKIYLATYAHGMGASGSTFFDDAVTEFFSPHAEKKSTMIAVGIGIPAYKASSGKILPVRLTREHMLKARL